MQDFRNLAVWNAARVLTRGIYELTRQFPHLHLIPESARAPRLAELIEIKRMLTGLSMRLSVPRRRQTIARR
jgi:hypothetical protein